MLHKEGNCIYPRKAAELTQHIPAEVSYMMEGVGCHPGERRVY